MRATCEKDTLERAIASVSRAISPRSPLPILSHVLIEARDGHIQLTATDLDLGVQTRIPAQVIEDGELTCPARLIAEIVGRFSGGPISLEVAQEGFLKLRSGRAEFQVSTLPAEEFPTLPAREDAPGFSLPQRALRGMIRAVSVAAADSDETRPVLTGMLTLLEPEGLTLVCTDGRRLARMAQPLEVDSQRQAEVVIPVRAMQELVRLLSDVDETVQVQVGEGQVFFSVGSSSLHTRLLEGTFPSFDRVIPREFQRTCRLGRDAFANSLRRMLIVAQEKDTPHLVRLEFDGDVLVLSANTPDLGSGRDEIPVAYEGEPMTIAFNGKFIFDVLGVLDEDEIQLDLQDETRSAVVRPLGNASYDYVVMPVRLREAVTEEASVPAGV